MKDFRYAFRGGKSALRFYCKRIIVSAFNFLATDAAYQPIQDFRLFLLKLIGTQIAEGSSIWENFYILKGHNLEIGEGSIIGSNCSIYDWYPIKIGRRLFASNNLTLVSASHKIEDYSSVPGPITIGDNVWIGINVTIVGPVTIGSGSVIGAGSVVLKDIPENVVAAGTPAKIIRKIERP